MARPVCVRVKGPGVKFIVIWSGNLATIPSGFQLCDGTNGTPDLRDRFITGADELTPQYESWYHEWGSDTQDWRHYHDYLNVSEESSHTHELTGITTGASATWGLKGAGTTVGPEHTHGLTAQFTGMPSPHTHSPCWGATDLYGDAATDLRPPYYALAYISGPGEPPVGAMVGWWGKAADVPAGYTICDGAAGTLDTVERLLRGADADYASGEPGGAERIYVYDSETDSSNWDHAHELGTLAMEGDGRPLASGFGDYGHYHDVPGVATHWHTALAGNGVNCLEDLAHAVHGAQASHLHDVDIRVFPGAEEGACTHTHEATWGEIPVLDGSTLLYPAVHDLIWLVRVA